MTTSAERTCSGELVIAISRVCAQLELFFLVPLGHWMSMDLHASDRLRITQDLAILAVSSLCETQQVQLKRADLRL